MSDGEGSQAGEERPRGRGRSRGADSGGDKQQRSFTPRPKLISGPLGDSLSRGVPHVGHCTPTDGQHITNYPGANKPVLLRRQWMRHHPNSWFDFITAKEEGSNSESSVSANYATGRPTMPSIDVPYIKTPMGPPPARKKPSVHHMLYFALPASWLEPNPDSLVHFKANSPDDCLHAICMSFLLSAVSNTDINLSFQNDNTAHTTGGTFRGIDGHNYPRTSTFIHTIFAPNSGSPDDWDSLIAGLPRDPMPGASEAEIRNASNPNISILNDLVQPGNKVGYLIAVAIHDPDLHPNALFAYNILSNRLLKGTEDLIRHEQCVESLRWRYRNYTNEARSNGSYADMSAPLPPPPAPKQQRENKTAPKGKKKAAKKSKEEEEEKKDSDEAEEVSEGAEERLFENSDAEAEEAAAAEKEAAERVARRRADPMKHDPMLQVAARLTALASKDGNMLLTGGDDESGSSSPDEEYNPEKDPEEAIERKKDKDDVNMADVPPPPKSPDTEMSEAPKDKKEGGDKDEEEDDGEELLPSESDGELDSEEEAEIREMETGEKPKRGKGEAEEGDDDEEAEDAKKLAEIRKRQAALKEQAVNLGVASNTGDNVVPGLDNTPEGLDRKKKEAEERKANGTAYYAQLRNRLHISRNAKEKLPWFFGRYILTLSDFSALVLHTYLTEAGSERAQEHEDGLYDTAHNLDTSVYQYNMYGVDQPLHYAEFFSFENARQILLRNFPGRTGTVCFGGSPQFSFEAYNGTKEDPVLRVPYPWLCTEYDTAHLNPEYLCWWRTPGALSAVEAILDIAHEGLRRHEDAAKTKPHARALYEHPRACVPHLVQGTIDAYESARPTHAPLSATDLLHSLKDRFTPTVTEFSSNRASIYTRVNAASARPVSEFGADIGHVLSLTPVNDSLRLSSKKRVASAEDIRERDQEHKRHHRDILSWLNYSLRLARTEEDRRTIQDAIAAIGNAADPSKIIRDIDHGTGAHAAVRDCCQRVTTNARSNGNGRQLAAKTSAATSNPIAQHFLFIYCNHTDRAAQELSASRVTGPIERLKESRLKLRDEIVSISQKMPFRTQVAELRAWLDTVDSGWRVKQTRTPTEMDAQRYGLPVSDIQVLWAMDFEHEERYRNEWLCTAMKAFRAETTIEVCSTLSVNNSELPNSIRSALVWLNTRPQGKSFVHPVMPFDPTLGQFATLFAREAIEASYTQKVNEALLPALICSLYTTRLSQLVVDRSTVPDGTLILGPSGTAKSEFLKTILSALPAAGAVPSHHKSRLSDMASDNKESTATLLAHDEAPAWMTASAGEFKLENREHRDMLKSVFTQQQVSYQRIVKSDDGKMRRESRVVPYVFNILTAANRYNAPADISDRIRLHTTFSVLSSIRPGGGRELRLGNKENDPEFQAALSSWKHERLDEYLITVFMESLIACGALSVNTNVLNTIITAGDSVLTTWYGSKFSNVSARLTGRAESDCCQFTKAAAIQKKFRSPLSPYFKSFNEKAEADDANAHVKVGDNVPRLAIDPSRAFVPSDLTHLLQTSLCASYGEAVPAYWNYLTLEALPFNQWRLLYAVATCLLGFSPDYFEPCYFRYGIQVPDVLERASQRHNRPIKKRSDVCSFLTDYYAFTTKLREKAFGAQRALASWGLSSEERAKYGDNFAAVPRPQFATVDQIARLIPSAADTSAGKRRTHNKGADGNDAPRVPDLNPSILLREFVGTEEDLYTQIHASISRSVGGVDVEVIRSLLGQLKTFMVEVPWHRSQNAATISAATLGFDGVTLKGIAPQIKPGDAYVEPLTDEHKGGKLVMKTVSLFRMDVDPLSGKFFIAIPTYALMCPWPEVVYLAMCAHEGPNTRMCRTILPIGHTEAPTLMHVWDVVPNAHGSNIIHTGARFNSVTGASRSRISVPTVLGGDDEARERQRRIQAETDAHRTYLHSVRDSDDNLATSSASPSSGFDCEMSEFARYLQAIYYTPPRDFPEPPRDILNVKDRYAWYAQRMIDAPGNTDAYIYHLWKCCPDLNNGTLRPAEETPTIYPDHDIQASTEENSLAAARMIYERNTTRWIDDLDWDKFERQIGKEDKRALEKVREVREFDQAVREGRKSIKEKNGFRDAVHISFHLWNEDNKRKDASSSKRDRLKAMERNGLEKVYRRSEELGYETIMDYLRSVKGQSATSMEEEQDSNDGRKRDVPASPARSSDVDAAEAMRRMGEMSKRMLTAKMPRLGELKSRRQTGGTKGPTKKTL